MYEKKVVQHDDLVSMRAEGMMLYLIEHHPVRVDLSITLRVQNDCLIGSEICKCDFSTFWTHVNHIHHRIIVKVILTYVTDSVP